MGARAPYHPSGRIVPPAAASAVLPIQRSTLMHALMDVGHRLPCRWVAACCPACLRGGTTTCSSLSHRTTVSPVRPTYQVAPTRYHLLVAVVVLRPAHGSATRPRRVSQTHPPDSTYQVPCSMYSWPRWYHCLLVAQSYDHGKRIAACTSLIACRPRPPPCPQGGREPGHSAATNEEGGMEQSVAVYIHVYMYIHVKASMHACTTN